MAPFQADGTLGTVSTQIVLSQRLLSYHCESPAWEDRSAYKVLQDRNRFPDTNFQYSHQEHRTLIRFFFVTATNAHVPSIPSQLLISATSIPWHIARQELPYVFLSVPHTIPDEHGDMIASGMLSQLEHVPILASDGPTLCYCVARNQRVRAHASQGSIERGSSLLPLLATSTPLEGQRAAKSHQGCRN